MSKTVVVFLIVALMFHSRYEIKNFIFPAPDYGKQHGGKVILYSTSWCGYCAKTRELFHNKGIEYFEYDIEKSKEGRDQYLNLGGRGVPVVLINGEVVKGYNPAEILRLTGGSQL